MPDPPPHPLQPFTSSHPLDPPWAPNQQGPLHLQLRPHRHLHPPAPLRLVQCLHPPDPSVGVKTLCLHQLDLLSPTLLPDAQRHLHALMMIRRRRRRRRGKFPCLHQLNPPVPPIHLHHPAPLWKVKTQCLPPPQKNLDPSLTRLHTPQSLCFNPCAS